MHRELILSYFRGQKLLSGGVVEGLNNKAKVSMRKSCGFRTYRVLELALYHSLGKSPNRNPPTISSDEPHNVTCQRCALARNFLILSGFGRLNGEDVRKTVEK